jgi:DUF971 family protein
MNAVELVAGRLSVHCVEGSFELSARTLRAACRCASCRAAERAGAPVLPASDVEVVRVNEVGGYALQLCFSDGHERGIYPWSYLAALAVSAP